MVIFTPLTAHALTFSSGWRVIQEVVTEGLTTTVMADSDPEESTPSLWYYIYQIEDTLPPEARIFITIWASYLLTQSTYGYFGGTPVPGSGDKVVADPATGDIPTSITLDGVYHNRRGVESTYGLGANPPAILGFLSDQAPTQGRLNVLDGSGGELGGFDVPVPAPELPAGALVPVMGLIGFGVWRLRRKFK